MSLFEKIGKESTKAPPSSIATSKEELQKIIQKGANTFKLKDNMMFVPKDQALDIVNYVPIIATNEEQTPLLKAIKKVQLYKTSRLYVDVKKLLKN